MKFSMYSGFTEYVREHGIEKAAEYAKKNGFSGVEFLYFARDPESIPSVEDGKRYKAVLDSFGLSVACVSMLASVVTYDEPDKVSEFNLDGLMRTVDFAAAVGSKFFHHTLMPVRNPAPPASVSYESLFPVVLEGAKRIADHAAPLGVTVIYEPQGLFFNGREKLGKFYREMKKNCKNVGLCGDFGNSYFVNEEPYALFEEFAEDILHVHVKDYAFVSPSGESVAFDAPDAQKKEIVIGKGDIDIKRLISIVKRARYDDFVSIEDMVNVQSPEVIKEVLDYVRPLFE
jgi:sugar phosphate isomerase/epimerase